jgi:hypothetical protein
MRGARFIWTTARGENLMALKPTKLGKPKFTETRQRNRSEKIQCRQAKRATL